MKNIFSILFLLLICLSVYAQKIEQAPMSEKYLMYNEMKGISSFKSGVLPLPFIPKNTFNNTKTILPTSFDLRDEGYIMPVRNQNPYGTCWAFSTAASLESTAMKKYGLSSISISPLNIANKNPYTWVTLDTGGNYLTSTAYLMQLLGPVAEADNPYKSPYTSPLDKYNLIGICEKASLIEDGEDGLSSDEILAIKQAVYDKGAVQLNYYHDISYLNSTYGAYYCFDKTNSNHAVTIVGWDDNFSKTKFKTTPTENGAFLIKNSWGTSWGESGYFWISYYDTSIGYCCQFEYSSLDDVDYDKLYSYDGASFATAYNIQYGKIKFLAQETGQITGLQLSSINGGITYDIDVYVNNRLKDSISYTFDYTGYENVPLDSPISFSAGDVLEAYFDFNADNNEDFYYVYPTEYKYGTYTPTVYSEPYCSYYSFNEKNYYSMGSYGNLACGLLISSKISVTSVSLDQSSISIDEGKTETLTATVLPENATDKNVTWSSDDENVATVENGVVTGISKGEATITVTTNDGGYTATCKVTVKDLNILVTNISLNKTSITFPQPGKSLKLIATVTPNDATIKKVIWSSSDNSIATVSSTGIVKAIKSGTATITCSATDGSGVKTTCNVTVKQLVTNITLNKTSLTFPQPGKSFKLVVTITPTDAGNKKVTWSSSDNSIATVSSTGIVKAIKSGTATITCSATDGSGVKATCNITVKGLVTNISLNKTSITFPSKGKSFKLVATITPTTATVKKVSWSSSDNSIATVSSTGIVKAIKAGTATITCSATDGSGVKATCNVKVK